MPSKQTKNYNLSQWEKTDKVLMDDFNADNLAIDAAIKAVDVRVDGLVKSKADQSALNAAASTQAADKSELSFMIKLRNCRIESASYTGDGYYNSTSNRTVRFSKRPVVFFAFGHGCLLVGVGDSTANILLYEGRMTSDLAITRSA